MLHLIGAILLSSHPWLTQDMDSTLNGQPLDSSRSLQLPTVEIINQVLGQGSEYARLSAAKALEHSGQPLARQLETLPGLSVLSAGGQLAKPVLNGLHSQRILILQDGVRLEGQAWGSDHAPEIDPFQEGDWTLLQAASSLRYGPEALGGVLDQQASPLLQHGHWDAHASTVGMTNNGLIGAHLRLQGPLDRRGRWQVRWQGSGQKSGNVRIPGAYLANTGHREHSSTLELQYQHRRWLIHHSLRIFQLRQGLYPGAHAENTLDLQNAFNSPWPLWPGSRSDQLDRPFQEVRHYQYSLRLQRGHSNGGLSQIRYGYQDNQRQEWDNRSFLPLPEMALALGTHNASYTYTHTRGAWRWEQAAGLLFQQNVNQASNARQFIRNYQSVNTYAYSMMTWANRTWGQHEWALRYDQVGFDTYYRPPGSATNDPVTRDGRNFRRWSAAWTWLWTIPGTAWQCRVNAGSGWRPPSANELYANGLHQGMAALEQGNPYLVPEQTQMINLGLEWKDKNLEFYSQVGLRSIRDYIFLEPLATPAITINGVYPQFAFVGRDAGLRHWNNRLLHRVGQAWKLSFSTALVRGRDQEQQEWLVWMPADRWSLGLHHHATPTNKASRTRSFWVPNQGGLEFQRVAHQSRVPLDSLGLPTVDYAPAPPGYSLLRLYLGGQLQGGHVHWMISMDNALNTRYRDYMNRLRYFADEPGLNLSFRLQYHLHRHPTS
ncbi:MAG: TonB-dependent receptor [Sphingobacteriia bacterium]|nr:TonB-dependent receptor [Sphingobacteriia bacterium]